MAFEERKAADRAIQEQKLHNSPAAGEQEAETDAFQCGRCKQVCFLKPFLLSRRYPLNLSSNFYFSLSSERRATDKHKYAAPTNR